MELDKKKIQQLRELIETDAKKVLIVSHTNPDGDAIGSSLAWGSILAQRGHNVTCMVPNRYPAFLEWIPGVESVKVFNEDKNGEYLKIIEEAELVFCLDFNSLPRLERLGDEIAKNKNAKYVLIDHHLDPDVDEFDLMFSVTHSSSTAFLVYNLIVALYGEEVITKEIAEAMYVGIITDTGNFSYSFLTADLFRGVGGLVDKGIDIPYVHDQIYNSFTVDRVKLLGHALNKMEVIRLEKFGVAYMTLEEAELRNFNFEPGDSEGFVNYPLTVRDLDMSAIFIETHRFIRISLRSTGDLDVSLFAQEYFEGGGHRNASGGKSYKTIPETVAYFKESLHDFFSRYPNGYDEENK